MAKAGFGRRSLAESALNRANGLLAAWALAMIAMPIALWTVGEAAFTWATSIAAVAQAAAGLAAVQAGGSVEGWPARRVWGVALGVAGLAWGVEFVGQATGWPFGRYDYTSALQPQLGGVPLLIPLAWLMMLLPAWAVAQTITAPHAARLGRFAPLAHALLAGLAFTAWDLYLDPQMVSRGLWVWEEAGAYFGVPLQNYFGWWASAALITLAVRPGRLPAARLRWIYIVTWLLQGLGLGLFWGQPGPALVGFLGMGGFVLLSFVQSAKSAPSQVQ